MPPPSRSARTQDRAAGSGIVDEYLDERGSTGLTVLMGGGRIEFDRAIGRGKAFAEAGGDTLVIVTADHECAGINIIGASNVNTATIQQRANNGAGVAGPHHITVDPDVLNRICCLLSSAFVAASLRL